MKEQHGVTHVNIHQLYAERQGVSRGGGGGGGGGVKQFTPTGRLDPEGQRGVTHSRAMGFRGAKHDSIWSLSVWKAKHEDK